MRFEHFIVTNFNVLRDDYRLDPSGRPIDRQGQAVRTEEWLEHRFGLFERFCLPSVLGQTNQNFTWIIRYDAAAPGDCGGRLQRYRAYGNLWLLPMPSSFSKALRGRLSSQTECVITTRLDNDDALHRDMTAEIQDTLRPGVTEFISFPAGYEFECETGRVAIRRSVQNTFVSFVEHPRIAPLRTALHVDHARIVEVAPVRTVHDQPRWLLTVHERNLANRPKGTPSPHALPEHDFNLGESGRELVRKILGAGNPTAS